MSQATVPFCTPVGVAVICLDSPFSTVTDVGEKLTPVQDGETGGAVAVGRGVDGPLSQLLQLKPQMPLLQLGVTLLTGPLAPQTSTQRQPAGTSTPGAQGILLKLVGQLLIGGHCIRGQPRSLQTLPEASQQLIVQPGAQHSKFPNGQLALAGPQIVQLLTGGGEAGQSQSDQQLTQSSPGSHLLSPQ